jgi:N-terminal domain of galactosyltransferase
VIPLWADGVSLRRLGAATVLELPRYLAWLARAGGWASARNRHEPLRQNPMGLGLRCDFEFTSGLNTCTVFPWLGRRLMAAALKEWPIQLADQAVTPGCPQLSVLLPFRGEDRLPLLLATRRSWLAQSVPVECIVIEQANESILEGHLPPGVRHLHLPHPTGDEGWRKSWAYNSGAATARTDMLVCHDADILVPQGYARQILDCAAQGFDSLHIQRFLFYVGAETSARIVESGQVVPCVPLDVRQNWLGGTLAIRREAYFRIGGFDERFVDWGGEDNEFFDRCTTLRQTCFGFLPFVHLWHAPQANKFGAGRDAAVAFMKERMAIPAVQRVAQLRGALQALRISGTSTDGG